MKLALVTFVAFSSLFNLSCRACDKAPLALDDAGVAIVEAPVPVPEGLVAEGVVTTPNATWARVQRGIGGAIAVLPASFGGLVCSLAGLDLAVAAEIDGAAPAYVALGTDEKGAVRYVAAVKVIDARHVRAALVEGATARFNAVDKPGMTVLVPKAGAAQGVPVVALSAGGYALLAAREEDLMRLGPYAYRTLPTRPLPESAVVVDVPRSALSGAVKRGLLALWEGYRDDKLAQYDVLKEAHGGREADFADPSSILKLVGSTFDERASFLGDLERVRLSVDPDDVGVSATVAVSPVKGGAVAAPALATMRPGNAEPLLALPRATTVAFIHRQDAEARIAAAREAQDAIARSLGARLPAADAVKIAAALDAWAKARGEWLTMSGRLAEPRGVALRTPVADAAAADAAVRAALETVRVPAVGKPLKELLHVRDVAVATAEAPGLGKVPLALASRVQPTGPKAKGEAPLAPIGAAWRVADGELALALSEHAPQLLVASVDPERVGRIGDDPAAVAAVKRLGDSVTFALLAQPGMLAPTPDGASAPPLVFAWGRRGDEGWGRLELGYPIVRDAMRRLTGF